MHSENLIAQALKLAAPIERGRLNQVDLRRAVSAAYYALFHAFCGQLAKNLVWEKDMPRLHAAIRRVPDHSVLVRECEAWSKLIDKPGDANSQKRLQMLPPAYQPTQQAGTAEQAQLKTLIAVFGEFVELQEKRIEADYDLAEQWKRSDCMSLVRRAQEALTSFRTIENSPVVKAFLLSVLLSKKR